MAYHAASFFFALDTYIIDQSKWISQTPSLVNKGWKMKRRLVCHFTHHMQSLYTNTKWKTKTYTLFACFLAFFGIKGFNVFIYLRLLYNLFCVLAFWIRCIYPHYYASIDLRIFSQLIINTIRLVHTMTISDFKLSPITWVQIIFNSTQVFNRDDIF